MDRVMRTKLKFKPTLWLGCTIEHVETYVLRSRLGTLPRLRFLEMPWLTLVGPRLCESVCMHKFGHTDYDRMNDYELFSVGEEYHVFVKTLDIGEDRVIINPELVLPWAT